jgi:hypothetical protein
MTNFVEPTAKLTPQPAGMKHRFHAMVKPAGSLCDLNCTCCYYLHKEGLLHQPKAPRMSDEVLEQHIRQYIEAQTGNEVVFSWQGGEPTLLGLEFFRKVVALEAKYKKPFQVIQNDLQTNGTLPLLRLRSPLPAPNPAKKSRKGWLPSYKRHTVSACQNNSLLESIPVGEQSPARRGGHHGARPARAQQSSAKSTNKHGRSRN